MVVGLGVFGLLVGDRLAALTAQILWFTELDYLPTFWTRVQMQVWLWVGVSMVSGLFWFGHLARSERCANAARHQDPQPAPLDDYNPARIPPYPSGQPMLSLRYFLPLVLGSATLLAWGSIQYGRLAFDYGWLGFDIPPLTPDIPPAFSGVAILKLVRGASPALWLLVLGIVVGVIVQFRWTVRLLAAVLVTLFGYLAANHWTRILAFSEATPFYSRDPLFHLDISFYLFRLPVLELLALWLTGLFSLTLLTCLLTYLCSGNSLSDGKFPAFSPPQLRHLYELGGLLVGAIALQHGINGIKLVYSHRGAVYGAGYTDVMVQLPWEIGLGCIALGLCGGLLYRSRTLPRHAQTGSLVQIFKILLWLYVIPALLGLLLTQGIQRVNVQPNELERETPYLIHSIAATRSAFGLNRIEAKTFDPKNNLTLAQIAANDPTIDNIRLWDTRPLLKANRQLQEIRLYYTFHGADIDRYQIQRYDEAGNISTQIQQMIVAPRELDYDKVEGVTKTWVNEHLVYTHGYGFTMSPVNQVGEGGLPAYDVQDIGTEIDAGRLQLAPDIVPESIPLGRPRIYFGELTHTHVMTSTKVEEFDFPSGSDNVFTTYAGDGGIPLNSWWRRLVFAVYLRDWPILFTQNFIPDTRILFRRTIGDRLRQIAPFLRYDEDPYLVVADVDNSNGGEPNYLYWIIDAYTTSDRYPYSDPGPHPFNYIRNSVKVVVDAYNGNVTFYIADPTDPIIQTWNKVFPKLFTSLEQLPPPLRAHLRYPTDLFSTQSERLLTYHMEDPRVFYNREDQWTTPQEIYADNSQPVDPYHLIMQLPGEPRAEFILLHPYSPVARPNLIAWLAARADGDNYGKLLLYQFPKQRLIFGISQIEALINQDPLISQQISLWDTQGSQVVQGNLLVIPIEESLFYVEPIYLEAERNSVPTLARVIIAYDNTIVMAPTLDEAIEELFAADASEDSSGVIRRPVETPGPLLDILEP